MPMPRSEGSAQVTFSPLMKICPSVTSRRPAIQFSSVDFPQPDEPRRTRNSPSAISKFRFLSTLTAPKAKSRFLISTEFAMICSAFDCASGDAADKEFA